MSFPNYKDDLNYAKNRLEGCYMLLLDGTPIRINKVYTNKPIVSVANMETGMEMGVPLGAIDMRPVKLGFLNSIVRTNYIVRNPYRYWKHGITSNNIQDVNGGMIPFNGKGFCDMLKGIYPKPERCLDYLHNGEKSSMAFSRNFGLSNTGKKLELLYQNRPVGKVAGKSLITLNEKFLFLNEKLQGDLHV